MATIPFTLRSINRIIPFLILALLLSSSSLLAEKKKKQTLSKVKKVLLPLDPKTGRPFPLSLKQVLLLVAENNQTILNRQLEVLTSDTELKKSRAPYTPILKTGVDYNYQRNRYSNSFTSGNVQQRVDVTASISKSFRSGTYFEAGVSNRLLRSSTPDNTSLPPSFAASGSFDDIFTPANLNHTALSLTLSQELLKNAFGYSQRRQDKIYRNIAEIQRQNLIHEIIQLTVSSMIQFWELSLAEENIRTSRRLLANIRRIRSITARKRRIGLSESFELHQWRALEAVAKTRLGSSGLARDNIRRELLRVMNLPSDLKLAGTVKLNGNLPTDLSPKKDIKLAYRTRADLRSLQIEKENTHKTLQIAKNQLLPSLKLQGRYSSRGFDPALRNSVTDSFRSLYPDASVGLKLEYPLWDEKARVELRNARIRLKQLNIQEKQLKRQIKDEIRQGFQQIQVSYNALLNAKKALQATKAFYAGLISRYRKGRFSSSSVKEALDSLVQSEQSYTEALVNFNINIIRYDLARDIIFKKHGIDIQKIIDKLRS